MLSSAPPFRHLSEENTRHCRPLRAISLNSPAQPSSAAVFRLERLTLQRSMSALDQLRGDPDAFGSNGGIGEDENTNAVSVHSKQAMASAAQGADNPLSILQQKEDAAALNQSGTLDGEPGPRSALKSVPADMTAGTASADLTADLAGTRQSPATAQQQNDRDAGGLSALAVVQEPLEPHAAISSSGGASPVRLNPPKVARDDSWPAIALESPVADHHTEDAPAAASPTASSTPVWKATPVPAAVDVSVLPEAASPAAEAMPPLPPPHPATPGKPLAAAPAPTAPAATPATTAAVRQPGANGAPAKPPATPTEVVRGSDKVEEVRESPVKVTAMAQQLASPAAQPPKMPGISPRMSREPSAGKAAALSTHDAVNTVNVAAKLQTAEFARKPGVDFVPYDELMTLRLEDGIDATRKDEYLSDADFEKVFGMNRGAYAAMPQWKRLAAKKQVNLF